MIFSNPDNSNYADFFSRRRVLVTGAAGTLGSEISQQLVRAGVDELILLDHAEQSLSALLPRIISVAEKRSVAVTACLASVLDRDVLQELLASHRVNTVVHAAAYKHVDLVELNAANGIRNNLGGTWTLAKASAEAGVRDFLMLSTDKACNPVSVMGASKRAGELCLQFMTSQYPRTRFFSVRFCNVYGSSDSVVPIFRAQIEHGEPLTITDVDASRYFIESDHAVALLLDSFQIAQNGDVLTIIDGQRIQIVDLASRIAGEAGKTLAIDGSDDGVPVRIMGLRPGEKLHEQLFVSNQVEKTSHPSIVCSNIPAAEIVFLGKHLEAIMKFANDQDSQAAVSRLSKLLPEFKPASRWTDTGGISESTA